MNTQIQQIYQYLHSHKVEVEMTSSTLLQGRGYIKNDEYSEPELAPFSIKWDGQFIIRYRNVGLHKTYEFKTPNWWAATSAIIGAVGYFATPDVLDVLDI